MSLSAEYYSDKTGDRGGGGGVALAHQRRLIRGLLVWATLLTLGLATSITLHFVHREPPAPSKQQNQETVNQPQTKENNGTPLMEFLPDSSESEMVENFKWITLQEVFIEIGLHKQLLLKEDGHYFLYLQVAIASHENKNHTITVKAGDRPVLEGLINGSKLSTVFMAKGISLSSGNTLNVTCHPIAKIQFSQTYLGVIKLNSS